MNKRERIVQAAIEVFREKGIEKTKISDIVKLAGIAQGTYYLYFSSKLAVMPAIAEVMVEKNMDEVRAQVKEDADFSVQLTQVIDAIFSVAENYHEMLAMIYAGMATTEHIQEWEAVYEPFYQWMSQFLKKAQANGTIRETVNTERVSKLVIGLVESAAEQIFLYDTNQVQEAEIQKKEVHSFLIHALGVKD
ncbi:TetR family transcriptional regulator [Lederbergia sp. NSJ-179]|uniref:TetR family transcriptional regulator n=1 Tax=Lederbergia sp. NSJ-179 TaxID=2931402 RepID=UPI001FD479F6|nr:TetR family transcriptional regulator [Lederbergia sp. NSJ-179]MCJ7840114.1 TetR family transcriptional regulator [Lederbergia sp. NSJ-179]